MKKIKINKWLALIVLLSLLLIGSLNGCRFFDEGEDQDIDNAQSFDMRVIDGNSLSYYGQGISEVRLKYGHYENAYEVEEYDKVFQSNNYSNYVIQYNGPYTIIVSYRDGTIEYHHFEVSCMPSPITLNYSQEDGLIHISKQTGYIVDFLYCTYGLHLGEQFAFNTSNTESFLSNIPESSTTVVPFGNGWHTFKIHANTSKASSTYYQAVYVSGIENPTIKFNNNRVWFFTYGFDVEEIVFAKGSYTSYESIIETNYYQMNCNTGKKTENLDKGLYSVCFKMEKQNYITTFTIE